jgi:hypothetical protein
MKSFRNIRSRYSGMTAYTVFPAILIIACMFHLSLDAQPYDPFTQITDDNYNKLKLAMFLLDQQI